jgi:hypothetical protein
MSEFPWGVVIILGSGLVFTLYVIYYILRMAYLEMQDEEPSNHSISDEPGN